jgi:hypothetical protein
MHAARPYTHVVVHVLDDEQDARIDALHLPVKVRQGEPVPGRAERQLPWVTCEAKTERDFKRQIFNFLYTSDSHAWATIR